MIVVYSGGNSDDPHDFGGSIASFRKEFTQRGVEHRGFDAINGWKNNLYKFIWMIRRILRLRRPFGWQFSRSAMQLNTKEISKLIDSQDAVISFYQLFFSLNFQYVQIIDCSLRYLFESYPEVRRISSDIVSEALRLEKESYSFAKSIFVPNYLVKEDLMSNYHISPNKIVIAPWSANNLSELSIPQILEKKCKSISSGIQFLFIGKDFSRNRLDKAVMLVNLISESGVRCHLHVVGGDGSGTIYKSNPNITFYGFLPNESKKLLNLLEICHVGLLFSDGEATGISLLEFQKAGLVTICSGKGGTGGYLFTEYCFVDSSNNLSHSLKYILELDIENNVEKIFSKSLYQGLQIPGFDYIVENLIDNLEIRIPSSLEEN